MYLNRNIANEVIREISPVINTDLNIMDSTGRILASTNPERIDTYHEGAYILIENRMDEFIVERENQYEGCRKGVNLPICLASEVVGVIGITGEPMEIMGYGRIIQKMTEMILYENFAFLRRNAEEQAKLLLINSLLQNSFDSPFSYVEEQLMKYNMNIEGPFTVAITKLNIVQQDATSAEFFQARIELLYKRLGDALTANGILSAYSEETMIAVSNLSSVKLYDIMSRLESEIGSQYDISLLCTISNTFANYTDIPKGYSQAITAFRYFNREGRGVLMFSTVNLDFILFQLPELHKQNLTAQIYKGCTKEETEEFSSFIKTYVTCDGSLNRMAEHLYMHKNTVQYKILKICDKTGFDLRKPHDLFLLYLASLSLGEAES